MTDERTELSRLRAELEQERSKRRSLQVQLAEYQQAQAAAGLCIKVALEGGLRTGDRWWLGEMDRVRDLVRDRYQLAARVERLERAGDQLSCHFDLSQIIGAPNRKISLEWDAVRNETTPAALAMVKAEAVREAVGWVGDNVDWIPNAIDKAFDDWIQRLIDEAGG